MPAVHNKSIDKVLSAIKQGLALGCKGIIPERAAFNMDDFRIPDNEGNQIVDNPFVSDEPAAYF